MKLYIISIVVLLSFFRTGICWAENERITNPFGITYEPVSGEFFFSGEVDGLGNLDCVPITRINKYYYVYMRESLNETMVPYILFQPPGYQTKYTVQKILRKHKVRVHVKDYQANGAYLKLPEVVCHYMSVFPYDSNSSDAFIVSSNGGFFYSFERWRRLADNVWFFISPDTRTVTSVPCFRIYNLWGEECYGWRYQYSGEKPTIEYLCYNYVTKTVESLPSEYFIPFYNKVYRLNAEEFLIDTVETDCAHAQFILNLKSGMRTRALYDYTQHHNLLIKRKDNKLCAFIKTDGTSLWEAQDETASFEIIDLDRDMEDMTEAFIIKEKTKTILVDTIEAKIYAADNIEHVGNGFFRCTTNAEVFWIFI